MNDVDGDSTAPVASRGKRRWIVAGLLVASVLVAGFVLRGRRLVIELTEDQIQQRLDAIFPVEKSVLLILDVTLSDPRVGLEDGADRVSFGMTATVMLPGDKPKSLTGAGTITAGLRYDAVQHAFFLDDPVIDKLEIQGIPIPYVERVNKVVMRLTRDRICNQPIYTLKPHELEQAVARMVLKDLVVQDGKLIITLGL